MDEVERLIQDFRTRPTSAAASKLDLLMDLEWLPDPRIVPFLLKVVADRHEPNEVRMHVLKRLRNGRLASEHRPCVAQAIIQALPDGPSPDLRLQAALALAEFTDINGVPTTLGSLALEADEPIDLRYAAFTSLERAGPTAECVALLRQLSSDKTLGRSARSVLSTWRGE